MLDNFAPYSYLLTAHTTPPLMTAVTGIAIRVKVRQNFELCAYLADNCDCMISY
jgi:hypothetical protein